MIKNKELFQRDPTTSKLLNDGVAAVKDAVTEQERETLRYELSQFVCEGQYKDGIVRILESYITNINSATQLRGLICLRSTTGTRPPLRTSLPACRTQRRRVTYLDT